MNALREIPAQIRGYYLMAEVRLRILPDMCLVFCILYGLADNIFAMG